MQSVTMLTIQVGSFRLRDPTTRKFLPSVPLMQKKSSKLMKNGRTELEEIMLSRNAELLFDLYNDHLENKKPTVSPEKLHDGETLCTNSISNFTG